ncbi:MAG: hypothetical protein M1821_005824 [Bathelium mastoideum]|nr:MAG: hypothetical protein M1821_005824 [Bathelium mastoideum]
MSGFYFGGSDSGGSRHSDSDDDNLPYPAPLPRSDFLKPNFSPAEYLSSLRNRHQTLEDLRSDLRARSQLLNKELLDLVNSNYQDFLTLGSSLHGGDEKVEEVRVGLMGFQREIEAVRKHVVERSKEVDHLVQERAEVRAQVVVGRQLLEFESRTAELEEKLMVASTHKAATDIYGNNTASDSEDTSDEEDTSLMPVAKLRRHSEQYLSIKQLERSIGIEHPFVLAQQSRLMRCRNTMLLDLSTALKQTDRRTNYGQQRLLKIIGMYREMGEEKEAIKTIKEHKP